MQISREKLLALAIEVLTRTGFAADEASSIAQHLVWADAAGRPTQGVWRLDTICERALAGGIRTTDQIEISSVAKGCMLVDGKDHSGHYVCETSAHAGMKLAEDQGIAALAIRNSNYCGALAYYIWLMAENGFVSLMWSNSFAKVRTYGGTKPVLGTNPMAFGAPVDSGDHILIDLSTSTSSGSAVRLAAELGSADSVSREGETSNNNILGPFGGAKGFALGLVGELLCGLLPTAEYSFNVRSMYGPSGDAGKNGQFMIILNPRAFLTPENYSSRIGKLLEVILADDGETRLPGSARHAALRASSVDGLVLSQQSVARLQAACRRVDISLPI